MKFENEPTRGRVPVPVPGTVGPTGSLLSACWRTGIWRENRELRAQRACNGRTFHRRISTVANRGMKRFVKADIDAVPVTYLRSPT
jgi:hypothetical protein